MLYDPNREWLSRASCRTVPPEVFFPPSGNQLRNEPSPTTKRAWEHAKKICSFCPVLTECRRDTLGEDWGVWGGLDEHERYLIRRKLGQGAWRRWPLERRIEWGEHLARLREQGHSVHHIRLTTGFSTAVCDGLIEQWRAWKAAQPKPSRTAEIVDLPIPDEPRPMQDFPEAPGSRHAWVRNGGLIADAWYAGETEDGEWVRLQVFSGRGNVIKWFRKDDVRVYNPQTPFYLEYAGRGRRERSAA
ncbi:WhiB family transcriptional regulator [Streptomyces coeruleoprunus]|uniref:Transcriptional regulator WhiB n=1 Tax=Streptomyces coeruleoprunus TaxID=285563 RepID=A0ABV9XK27_9ACTN